MIDDFQLLVHKLDKDLTHINVYPIGDLHIGSGNLDMGAFNRWQKMVIEDDNAKVVITGDMLDNGLKNSRTNSYDATMSPFEQKKLLYELLLPIKDKIIGAVQGNHEYRSTLVADLYPLYDVLAKLDLEHTYRQNMTFMKINLGQRTSDRQCSYTMVLAHGGSKAKTDRFRYAVEGMDVLVTSHIHQPQSGYPSKIVIDKKNEVVRMADFTHIVTPSFQGLGGYALRGMYMPQSHNTFPIIRFDGTTKHITTTWT